MPPELRRLYGHRKLLEPFEVILEPLSRIIVRLVYSLFGVEDLENAHLSLLRLPMPDPRP